MGLAFRNFLLDQNDVLFRLPNTTFEQMLRKPESHHISRFANARARMASVAIELLDRRPVRGVRRTFCILAFDGNGSMDSAAFDQHQRAIVELALDPVLRPRLATSDVPATLVEAATRFVVQGGRWTPSRRVLRLIDQAALGRLKCARL
jgi:hypothetical protein